METINVEKLLDPIEREKMKKKFEEEFKLSPQKLEEVRKLAQGGEGKNPTDVENARYILFIVGESYGPKAEGKGFWGRTMENASMWAERKAPFIPETTWNKAMAEERERYWEQLKRSKENGLPTNFEELKSFIEKKRENSNLERERKQYDKDLGKIEAILSEQDFSRKSKKIEKTSIGGKLLPGLLKKYNPGLYKTARRVNQLDQVKKLSKIPSLERALLEVGRPDLVYGPEKLAEYLKRMDREGLPVSKLSAEVWQCSKAIDALSEAQLYELATEGNPAALECLRKNVAKNPWLLVGNKNMGGKYETRRGTGVSKFVLKSALGFDIKSFTEFLVGAQEIMPAMTASGVESRCTFGGWTKELLSKETGEDVLGWDDLAFRPKDYKDKYNPTFDLFTRYAHPGQLGLIPPNGTLAEKRKPIITDLLIKHKNNYADEVTKKYIEKLEQTLSSNPEQKIKALEKELKEAQDNLSKVKKGIKIDQEKRNLETTRRKMEVGRIASVLTQIDRLSQTLPPEAKEDVLYKNLKAFSEAIVRTIDGLEKIEDVKSGDEFKPEKHKTNSDIKTGETQVVSKVILPGYKFKDEIIIKPEVELK